LKTCSLSKSLHSRENFVAQEKNWTVSCFPICCEKQYLEYRWNTPIPAYMDGKKWISICINWRHSSLRNACI